MVKSAYIHIPFCKSKCKYCSFVSFNSLELITDYCNALLKDIDTYYQNEELNTLYFGGGTPSLLPIELLDKIIKKINLANNYELTLEINPDDASLDYLKKLKEVGVNRLSIGSQTFNDEILKLIGRRHNSSQIISTVEYAKKAGFDNISVDLIYGLPIQTIDSLEKDLESFLKLGIQHISTYGLKIEEDSFWGKQYEKLNIQFPDEDTQADMYEIINNTLEPIGFYRYEISNFAQKGFESKHNLNYWNNNEYYGFGAAAHGYVNGIRYSNYCNLKDYINNSTTHKTEKVITEKEKLEEEIFLGFRKREGINVSKINTQFNLDFDKEYSKVLNSYSDFIEKTPDGYTLNLKGTLLSNIILSEFI